MPVDEEFERTSTFLWTCKRWMHVFGTSASIRASLDVRKDAFQKRVRRIRRISKRDVVGLRVDPEKAFLSFIGSMSNHPFLCVAFSMVCNKPCRRKENASCSTLERRFRNFLSCQLSESETNRFEGKHFPSKPKEAEDVSSQRHGREPVQSRARCLVCTFVAHVQVSERCLYLITHQHHT